MMQPRFEKRVGHTPFSLVEQPRFRAAFDFMRLRAETGEVDVVLADWWQEFSQASDELREDLVAQLRQEQHRGQRRVRPPRPPALPAGEPLPPAEGEGVQPSPEGAEAGADAPRKRRRRRRKPSGAGGAGPGEASAPGDES